MNSHITHITLNEMADTKNSLVERNDVDIDDLMRAIEIVCEKPDIVYGIVAIQRSLRAEGLPFEDSVIKINLPSQKQVLKSRKGNNNKK